MDNMQKDKPIKFIQSQRVYLRPIEDHDSNMVYENLWDREGRCLTGTQTIFSRSGVQRWIENLSEDESRIDLIICLQKNDQPIGDIAMMGIDHQNQNAIVRIAIFEKEYLGKGYGTEAMSLLLEYGFDILNLHRIELEVFAFNKRAKKSYEKLGFKQEGVIRDKLYYNGEFHDSIMMGVLKNEFINYNKKELV